MHRANGFTRREILSLVKMNGSMTAEALGKELSISPVAVRQHLAALEAEGYIATSVERRGLGRPVHRYTITARGDETFPRGYDVLANALLEELRFSQGEKAVDRLFGQYRERQRAANQPRMEGKSLPGKVAELAKIQSENGYMAEMRQDEDGYRLIEHNCAICRVARNLPAACASELLLFRQLVGEEASVVREQHMMAGDHTCAYLIRPKN